MIPRKKLAVWYLVVSSISIFLIVILGLFEIYQITNASTPEERYWHEIAVIFVLCIPTVLLIMINAYWILTKILSPINHLTQTIERIHEGNLHERLPCKKNGDELDRLTEVFNSMTTRLDNSFQRIREFTLHASHELKTPLTIMHGELETTLQDSTLTKLQVEHLASQLEEVQRLTKIVDSLTLLAKADAGLIQFDYQSVPLDLLIQEIFADAQVLADSAEVEVKLSCCDHLMVIGDRQRLRQLLLNLIDNAIKYNHAHGTVTLALRRTDKSAEIQIANSGAGVPIELQPRLFERFFRCYQSHSTKVEGCGLGLSLAQWIATAHNGKIQLTSQPNQLTTVTVHLPLANEKT